MSAARTAPYLAAAGTAPQALQLYRWDLELSGACHEVLGVVEVIVRNALDDRLRRWNAAQAPAFGVTYTAQWLENPARPLWAILNPSRAGSTVRHSTYLTAMARAEADRDARLSTHPRQNSPITHDDLVAHVTLGTWARLLPRRQANGQIGPPGQVVLWNNALRAAFPNHPNPTVVWNWLDRMRWLRNRVAHHECLLGADAVALNRMAIRLVRAIDGVVGDWLAGISRVPDVVKRRP